MLCVMSFYFFVNDFLLCFAVYVWYGMLMTKYKKKIMTGVQSFFSDQRLIAR